MFIFQILLFMALFAVIFAFALRYEDSDFFPCPNMFTMSAKVLLFNSVTSEMSGGCLLMMLLYLWPMLLLVVGVTVTHFLGDSPISI